MIARRMIKQHLSLQRKSVAETLLKQVNKINNERQNVANRKYWRKKNNKDQPHL
jgi:hypothetical protein